MKQLTCEMCGGTDLIKQDGVYVCQNCGMKYSVEEAKKMMIEGTVDVQGTVKVDNSHMIENYLEMAQTARDAGNNAEAESYCNKVIEIEPTNYKALILKGEAAAWQSTLQNSRIDEGVMAFIKGINNAPEEEKGDLIENAKAQVINLSLAMVSLRADRFAKWPDEEETAGFISDLTSIFGTVITFATQTKTSISKAELMVPIAKQIDQSVLKAYKYVITPDYYKAGAGYGYEWQTFTKRSFNCVDLMEKAIGLCDEDDEDNIKRYEDLITLVKPFAGNNKMINECKAKIKEIKASVAAKQAAEKAEKERVAREEAQKRFDAYWAEHTEEKAALEAEQKDLNSKIDSFNKEIAAIPGQAEIDNVDEHIKKLTKEKSALGLFKGKEKKALQEQIDQANADKKGIQERMDAARKEIEVKISPLKKRVKEISYELTKAR